MLRRGRGHPGRAVAVVLALALATIVLSLFASSRRRRVLRHSDDIGVHTGAIAPALVSPDRVRAAMEAARVPGLALALVSDGAVAFSAGYGDLDRERVLRVGADTPFEAASIAKTVVAIAVLQLAERRAIDLDADVSRLLPFRVESPWHPDVPVTARMLLAHTAAIADDLAILKRRALVASPSNVEVLARYVSVPDHFFREPPGTRVVYSNAGYALAALLVERAAGAPFDAYARRNVLEPLGMRSSSWHVATERAAVAVPYRWADGGYVALGSAADHVVGAPVDLFSTARDLAVLAAALLDGGRGVLSPATVGLMFEQRLGVQVMDLPGGLRAFGHEGEDDGASTAMVLDRTTHRAAVVLTNGDAFASGDSARARAIAELARDLLTTAVPRRDRRTSPSSP